jgi:hypothetical protein
MLVRLRSPPLTPRTMSLPMIASRTLPSPSSCSTASTCVALPRRVSGKGAGAPRTKRSRASSEYKSEGRRRRAEKSTFSRTVM